MILRSDEVGEASVESLAQCILDNADGRPLGDSFVRVAAVELARRVLPDKEAVQLPENYVNWHWRPETSGEALPRSSETRRARIAGDQHGGAQA